MRVVMVSNYFARHRSGIELVAGRLCRELSAGQGLDVSWFAAGPADPVPPAVDVRMFGVPANNWLEDRFGIPYPIWKPGIRPDLDREIRSADVVVLHDALYHGSRWAAQAARANGKPVLVVQHIGVVPYRRVLPRWAARAGNRLLAEPLLERADRVVFISEDVRRFFTAHGLAFRTAPLVIFNGVDTEVFGFATPDARVAARERLGLPLDRHVVLFVGRFVEKKGLAVIRELARLLPEPLWLLAGWGVLDPDSWGHKNVRTERDRAGADVAALYHAADLLVLPSVGEGFPLVIQEALATGLLVFAGLDSAAADGAAGAFIRGLEVRPEDPGRSARTWAIELRAHLAVHPPLAHRDGAAAAMARERWSWAAVGGQYARILRSMCPPRAQAAGVRPGGAPGAVMPA